MNTGRNKDSSRVWITDSAETASDHDKQIPTESGLNAGRITLPQTPASVNADRVRGQFIGMRGIQAIGWAYDPDRPDEPVVVEILNGDDPIATGVATMLREDSGALLDGKTHSGFRIRIPNAYLDGREVNFSARVASLDVDLESESGPFLGSALPGWSVSITALEADALTGQVEIDSTDADQDIELELWIDGIWADQFYVSAVDQQRAITHFTHPIPESIRDGETWTSIFDGEVHEFVLTAANRSLVLAVASFPTPAKALTYSAIQARRPVELATLPRFVRRFIDRAVASALFNTSYYSAKVKTNFASDEEAVLHYLSDRKHWRHATSPWMDVAFINGQAGDAIKDDASPLEWYLRQGPDCDVGPNPLFSNADYRIFADRSADTTPTGASFFDDWLSTLEGTKPTNPSALVDLHYFARSLTSDAETADQTIRVALQAWLECRPKDRPLNPLSPYFDQDWLSQCYILRHNEPQRCPLSAFRLGLLEDQSPHPVLQFVGNGCNYYDLIRTYELLAFAEGLDDINRISPAINKDAFYSQFPKADPQRIEPTGLRSSFYRYLTAERNDVRNSFLRKLDDQFIANVYPGLIDYCSEQRHIRDINYIWGRWLQLLAIPGTYEDSVASGRAILSVRDIQELRSHKPKQTSGISASFIIPTYARDDLVLRCILSALQSGNQDQVEFIIAEDAAHVDASWILGYFLPAALIYKNPTNLGFVLSAKEAVTRSIGDLFILVNNDVIVHKNSIGEILATFLARQDAAVVGGLVLNTDGTIQENSGMLWNDASAWNYHRNLKLEQEHVFNVREADYVSGCWIGIRRSAWDALGGFDERFAPAYYEETDFCLNAWRHGFKVYVNPLSVVTHLDGATMGQDQDNPGSMKSYQKVNRLKFYQKWRNRLHATHNPNGRPTAFHTGRQSPNRFISIIFDHYIPEPDRDAGSRTMLVVCQALASIPNNYVIFVPANNHRSAYASALERLGIEVISGVDGWKRFGTLLDESSHLIQYALVSRIGVAEKFKSHVDQMNCRKSLYIHDIEPMRAFQHDPSAPGHSALVDATMTRYAEKYGPLFAKFDDILSLSEDETSLLQPHFGKQVVDIFPYDFTPRQTGDSEFEPNDILFIGSYNHPPNREGIEAFIRTIWPDLHVALPKAHLHLCGSGFEKADSLAGPGIVLHGMVSDQTLSYLYSISRVSIAPLLSGAGVKGKVIESCAHGVPCVGTELAWQGIGLPKDFEHLCGSFSTFAERVQKTYQEYNQKKSTHLVRLYKQWRSKNAISDVIPRLVNESRLGCLDVPTHKTPHD